MYYVCTRILLPLKQQYFIISMRKYEHMNFTIVPTNRPARQVQKSNGNARSADIIFAQSEINSFDSCWGYHL
ncbi:hypothetical protein N483_22290 [Pseudoalteromonas luteoviolacea NCIMB 1944]|nr:hypothetical protein N483_22290 [Pseudoalteromonas luteoviolacea NCIMB 1944]